jgi:tail lysozyme
MAATVEGLFKIIDGASGPMQRMERQAKKTDKSIENLGERLDNVGSDKQLKQMDSVDRQIKTIDRDARTFSGSSGGGGRLRDTLRGAGDDSDRLSTKLGRVGISLASIGKIFQAMKLPLIVSGIVALVQGVSALAGGAAALIPKLTDLAGVAAALPATFLGIGVAVVGAKIAFSGIDRAMKGTKGAMRELTPQAREFVRVLKELKPVGKDLQRSAQRGLFPGLTGALSQLKRGVPTAEGLLERGGGVLGSIAERAAGAFTNQGFLKDLTSVGNQGLTVLQRIGSGLINLAEAFRHIAVSAEPFTEWLSETILGWTQWAENAAKAGRETGTLSAYFDRTRAALETFGSILHNVWEIFQGIGKASRPLGESLWESADKATEKWARFANSLKGQATLREWFDSLKRNIEVIFDFVAKLGSAIAGMGGGGGFARVAESLTRALEPLEHLFMSIGETYGPALAVTLEQLVRLFDNLGGGSSVLLNVVELFNKFLEAVNALLEAVPGLNNLIIGVLGAFALRSLAARIDGIAGSWMNVARSAETAAGAQRAAAGASVPTTIAGSVGGRRGPLIGPQGRLYNTRPNTSFIAGPIGSAGEATAVSSGGSRFFGGLGLAGGARAGLAAAGRFFWPIMAFSALAGGATTEGDVGEKIQGGLSAATFGLLPGPVSPTQRRAEATADEQRKIKELLGETPRTRGGMLRGIHQLRRRAGNLRGDQLGLRNSSDPVIAQMQAAGVSISEMRAQGVDRHDDTGDNARLAEITKAVRGLNTEVVEQSKEAGANAANAFGEAWTIRLKHQNRREAGASMLNPILTEMRKIGPQGAKVLAQSSLSWYRQAAKENPKLAGQYHQAAEAIERSFAAMGKQVMVINGRIYEGTQTEWHRIKEVMSSAAEEARQEVSHSLTKLQEEAVASLRAMGYTPQQARNIVKSEEAGHPTKSSQKESITAAHHGGSAATPNNIQFQNNKARGGRRIAGYGTTDRYAMGANELGAAGELVINRHTERDANEMLAPFGTSLGRMVAGEGRPHSEVVAHARGGRRKPAFGSGMSSVKAFAESMGLAAGEGPGEASPGVHVPDSLHYAGLAYDVSGAPNLMYAFRRAAEQRYLGHGLNELFYDPYPYYIDNGAKVPGSIGGHSDHVHIGFFPGGPMGAGTVKGLMGAAMAGAGGFKRVKAPNSKQSGVPGAMANAGMKAIAAGLNRKIAAHAGMGAAAGNIVIPRGAGGGGVERTIARILMANGLNRIGAAGVIGNAYAESGDVSAESLSPGATGFGGGGLWGFTSSPYSLADLQTYAAQHGKPWTSAALQTQFLLRFIGSMIPGLNSAGSPEAAAAFFMNEFEKPGIPRQDVREAGARLAFSHGYSTGGRRPNFAGWFGSGGMVSANSPTLLGIGERGGEVASVRPINPTTAGAGRGGVSIGELRIENHRTGDVRKQVEREVSEAFRNLESDLQLEPDTADSEVL